MSVRCTNPARVEIGVLVLATDRTPSPPRLAREVEMRNLDMLFLPENSHIPRDRKRDWPPVADMLDPLSRLYDPFVALSAAAAVTERLLLGFAVCLMTHRDPINTAKAIASLDLLSSGRVIFGVAGGALDVAMRNHGTEFRSRWKVVRERVLAMRTIWADDEAAFSGEFVDFGPMWCYPKPLQPVGPPIWIGSNSKWVPGRVADYADGWIVFHGRYDGDAIADLRAACAARGRDFSDISVALADAPWDAARAADFIARGYRKLIFMLPPDEDPRHALDRAAVLAEAVKRRVGA